jgi:drug/metabolite transporter (DMT)-like permease
LCAAAAGLVVGDLDLTPGPESLFWLLMLGFTSQFLGYLLISVSLPRLPAVVTSIILLAQPVVTVALSIVLLGEAPSAAQLAGVGLVIGGIAIATVPAGLARRAAAARARQEAGS